MNVGILGLFVLAFIWGFRHGVDWDHIAAILDLTGGEKEKKKGFQLAIWYAVGHEVVIITLGAAAVLFGSLLPGWIDHVMERLVGITLIILSIFLLNVLFRKNKDGMIVSRWRLLYNGFSKLFVWIGEKVFKRKWNVKHDLTMSMSRKGAFFVGVIHGIGAETPSQLLLFAAASGAGSSGEGLLTVALFVVGLLVSHLTLALVSLFGFSKALKKPMLFRSIGIISSLYSLGIGFAFAFGFSSLFPSIL